MLKFYCAECGAEYVDPKEPNYADLCPRCRIVELGGEEFLADPVPLPDSNPKTAVGLTKPSLRAIPPAALLHLGRAMSNGEGKYGLFNWREHAVSSSVYYDAAMRHLLAWWDGENEAADSGVHHLAHVMACCAIVLDAHASGKLNDNRGLPGAFPELVEGYTRST